MGNVVTHVYAKSNYDRLRINKALAFRKSNNKLTTTTTSIRTIEVKRKKFIANGDPIGSKDLNRFAWSLEHATPGLWYRQGTVFADVSLSVRTQEICFERKTYEIAFWTKKTKFAILDKIWTKNSQIIAKHVVEFDFFLGRNMKFLHIHWTGCLKWFE